MNDWNIQARARVCQSCERGFTDKDPYHTLLFEQRSGFERMDICAGCWDAQHKHGSVDRKGFISHWQGVFTVPPPPAPEAIQKDSAESLLRGLLERNDPEWQPAAYILAVMLERKRILKVREQFRQGGRRVFVYELPKTGDVFSIADPELRLDQLEQVQRDVARLLEEGLPVEGVPTEEPFLGESSLPLTPSPEEVDMAEGDERAGGSAEAKEGESGGANSGEAEVSAPGTPVVAGSD